MASQSDDEAGHGIETDNRLTALLEEDGDELWLLPALALHHATSGEDSDGREGIVTRARIEPTSPAEGVTARRLTSSSRVRRFREMWSGQPI